MYHRSFGGNWLTVCLFMAIALSAAQLTGAQEAETTSVPSGLSLEQQRLASRFERLEAVAARLAELANNSEPERAEQLRRAIKASREKGIAERFGTIVNLLETERLSAAAKDQTELQAELELLLQVLLEDPDNSEREAMKKFLKAQIREINKLIRQQRSLRNQNEEGADTNRLADKQNDVNESAGEVQEALEEGSDKAESEFGEGQPQEGESAEGKSPEGKPKEGESQEGQQGESQQGEGQQGEGQQGEGQQGEGQQGEGQQGEGQQGESQQTEQQNSDPIKNAAQRVERARQRMEQAEKKLRDAQQRDAKEDQREAQRELEAARAELERILRQLREEEMERLLAKLVSRFRDMLAKQESIYDDTMEISAASTDGKPRNLMLQSIRLSRRESELVRDAEKALTLLREDGTSVAFPEATEQLAEDMRSTAARLATADVGPITQTVELDIITGLKDMIQALDQARDELAQQQGDSPQPGGSGEPLPPGEERLLQLISELKMIRTLQARVYKRTQDLGALADNPQVDPAELKVELDKLAERQERIFQATHDLHTQANQ
ncbi:hypothetical protein NG895_28800 [Aeoliella sp. ICT_H6.2]|uniref:Uncharacterized protein n=1 Tax=Aeoliella straminimaris TaxID=2954799 RepID=A0A9X2JKA4_9BACT|nr:hypothetical protein [Aeoliella straminimaris]MCO6047923.1 hypothetical protein [Aeoliella straminimaris]